MPGVTAKELTLAYAPPPPPPAPPDVVDVSLPPPPPPPQASTVIKYTPAGAVQVLVPAVVKVFVVVAALAIEAPRSMASTVWSERAVSLFMKLPGVFRSRA